MVDEAEIKKGNRRGVLLEKISDFSRKPFTAEEQNNKKIDAGSALGRFHSIRNIELFADYKNARKEAGSHREAVEEGVLKANTIIVPEIMDIDLLDARLLAYFESRKFYLDKQAKEIKERGRMANVEEKEAQRCEIAMNVLTGESHFPESKEVLIEEVGKIKDFIDEEYGDTDLKEEYRAQLEYADKISENIRTRFK